MCQSKSVKVEKPASCAKNVACNDREQDTDYIPGGYIIIARSLIESEVMNKPSLYFKLWIYMLISATHKKSKGKLSRGQLLVTYQDLLKVGKYYKGCCLEYPSEKQVRAAVEWFQTAGMISKKRTTRGMIISITNYDHYQDPEKYQRHKKNAKDKRSANDKPPEGSHQGQDDGNSQNAENNELDGHIGHAEGHNEGNNGGNMNSSDRALDRQEWGKCDNEDKAREEGVDDSAESSTYPSLPQVTPSIDSILNQIQDSNLRGLLESFFQKISRTRKSGRISAKLVNNLLVEIMQYENWKVYAAVSKYLKRECWLEGKDEKYLLGMLKRTTIHDYYEVESQEKMIDSGRNEVEVQRCRSDVKRGPMPKTYAQAQDAERRIMINYIKTMEG